MPQITDPIAHWEDLEARLSSAMNHLTPKAFELLLLLLIIVILRRLLTHDPRQSYSHQELAKITGSLSHILVDQLKLSDKSITHLQQEMTHTQRRIDKLEEKAQYQLKRSEEKEQEAKKEIAKLQETLATTQNEKEEAKAAQKDLADKLQYAKQLLEKAKSEVEDKNAKIKALEGHLEKSRDKVESLTLQLDHTIEEADTIKEELKHAYELTQETRSEGAQPRASPALTEEFIPANRRMGPIHADTKAVHGLTLKDLDRLARNINKFTPNAAGGYDVQAYLQDIDFHLETRPQATNRDRLFLLRTTSSSEVRSFLDRQPVRTKSNYQLLRQALIKEFADPESEHGLLAALETKQGWQENPRAYYNRLRRAYFGAHNEPDLEEDMNFKTLFIRNLHPGVSHHLGVMACPRTMTVQQLRDLTQKAYIKQKMASRKGNKTSMVSITQDPTLALEDWKEWREPITCKKWYPHANAKPRNTVVQETRKGG
ncbi:CAP-Gly domain-containing linker protein 1-like [Pangasianodon hypophthalmus]|uniref:CAP-Gly domain-containing linker protein 1-like n=1 Tax=Pangasianodon hypophthalmus TaxID=310915 RepID=UPI002307AFB0|nr:CAP-Gly domain-containing linker protein 1-like [Pangasianodon hypophthalmus]